MFHKSIFKILIIFSTREGPRPPVRGRGPCGSLIYRFMVSFTEAAAASTASVAVCTLFFKPASYRKSYTIQYRAMEIGNEFIVGYGLDYDQLGRSLKDIYVVTE